MAQKMFPSAQGLFTFQPKSLTEMKDSCLVALDTNVLLLPYTVGAKSLDEIRKTFAKLIGTNRLILPGQVAREFVKNRPEKLKELYQKISDHKSQIKKIETPKYPLFDSIPAYQDAIAIQTQINDEIVKYQQKMKKVLDYIKELNWDDHVSKMYTELFNDELVVELEEKFEEYIEQFKERSEYRIPPGTKDLGKEDGGIGDYLIWKTLLEVGAGQKKDLLFVTGEEKNDWFYQSMKEALYPRYELIDEYKGVSEGKTINFTNLSGLLALFGAADAIIGEVQIVEKQRYNNLLNLNEKFNIDDLTRLSDNKFTIQIYTISKNMAEEYLKRLILEFEEKYPVKSSRIRNWSGFFLQSTDPNVTSIRLEFDKNEPPGIEFVTLTAQQCIEQFSGDEIKLSGVQRASIIGN